MRAVPCELRRAVSLGLFAATAALLTTGPGRGGPEPTAPPRALELTGRVEPVEQADLYARVTGYVQKVHADIGDRVKAGQVLAELSVPELAAELEEKKAQVVRARAEVEKARRAIQAADAAMVAARAQTDEAVAGVRRAGASYEFAKKQLERFLEMSKKQTVSPQVVEEKRLQAEGAKAAVAQAEARSRAAEAAQKEAEARRDMAGADAKAAEAGLQVAQAAARRAETMLQYSRVSAPFDGVVTRRGVAAGDLAGPAGDKRGELLFGVARVDRVRVVVDVPEGEISLVRKGTRATVRAAAWPKRTFTGEVARLMPAVNREVGTVRVEVDVPNPKTELLPGMFVRVSLEVTPAEGAER